jgi:hypothetical protein
MQQAIQLRTGKQLKFVYQTQDTKKQGEGNSLDRGICMVMRILLFLGPGRDNPRPGMTEKLI